MAFTRLCLAVLVPVLLLCAPAAQANHRLDPDDEPVQEEPWPADAEEPPPAEDVPVEEPGTVGEPLGPLEPPVLAPLPEAPPVIEVPLVRTATIPGETARLRTDGRAAIPRGAPKRIRTLIAAMNRIVGKPYKWGGGHARIVDRGYDCSGAVSYGLIGAGMLTGPRVSGDLATWGTAGRGRWVTVYANKRHVYLEVAGLRLDTSAVGDTFGGRGGVRWRSLIGKRRGFAARHPRGS
jgi:hypothetical protein